MTSTTQEVKILVDGVLRTGKVVARWTKKLKKVAVEVDGFDYSNQEQKFHLVSLEELQ